MSFVSKLFCCLAALAVAGALSGCFPSGQSQLDEEKEPHFLEGKSRVNQMDYAGAAESFEKALEVNPQSASAHFELALLCEKNEMDYAAAIYHYECFLKLRPKSDYADVVQQRVLACKQELARTVSLGPVTQDIQQQFEQLTDENKQLRDEVEKWRAYYRAHPQLLTNASPQVVLQRIVQPLVAPQPQQPVVAQQQTSVVPSRPAVVATPTSETAPRTYVVKAGDSPYAIAKRLGVKLNALLEANPDVDPKRLRIGQTLNIPAP